MIIRKNQGKKILTSSFLQKLEQLINASSKEAIKWTKNQERLVIKHTNQLEVKIRQVFNINWNSFQKYLKILGFKQKKLANKNKLIYCHQCLKHKVDDNNDEYPNDQQNEQNIRLKPALDEISLEWKLKKDQEIGHIHKKISQNLFEAQHRKQEIVTSIKTKYDRCNNLIDNVIYTLLIGHKNQIINQQSVLNQITQIQDLFAQNQQQLNNCINFLSKQAEYQEKVNQNQNSNDNIQQEPQKLKFNTLNAIQPDSNSK